MTREKKKEEAIARIMGGLHCSREEAEEVYSCDIKIDHEEKVYFDLPPDKARIGQKFAHTGTRERKPTIYKFNQRAKKRNATKEGIIAEIADFIEKNSSFEIENFQIPNKEGKIGFKIGKKWYTITLTCHREKPKNYIGD